MISDLLFICTKYLYNSINSYLKISLLLVNIYNNTDCQQRQNIAVKSVLDKSTLTRQIYS